MLCNRFNEAAFWRTRKYVNFRAGKNGGYCFNEAAFWRTRKCNLRRVVAELELASMRPRSGERGNEGQIMVLNERIEASMRPRSGERGNGEILVAIRNLIKLQ